nr:MAG TPA: hypothetical protein [Caudoviricetes sp.]
MIGGCFEQHIRRPRSAETRYQGGVGAKRPRVAERRNDHCGLPRWKP